MEKKNRIDLSLVGIHASILSIIIALLSAYGLFVFGNLDELEYRAFSEYSKINNLALLNRYRSPRHQFQYLLDIPTSQQYKSVIREIWQIASIDLSNNPQKVKYNDENIMESGIQLLCGMTVLQNIYPYATRITFSSDGEVVYIDSVKKVELHSIDEIRQWIEDIDSVLKVALYFYSQRKGRLDELVSYATFAIENKFPPFESDEELNKMYTQGDKSDLKRWRKSLASSIVNKFFQNIEQTQQIFINTKKLIEDYDLYDNRHINKTIFAIGILLTFIAFITSVIIPIILNIRIRLFDVWVPVATYIIIFTYLISKILFL